MATLTQRHLGESHRWYPSSGVTGGRSPPLAGCMVHGSDRSFGDATVRAADHPVGNSVGAIGEWVRVVGMPVGSPAPHSLRYTVRCSVFQSTIRPRLRGVGGRAPRYDRYLVDSASSHMLVSKIKPCMSKYKQFIQ